MDTSYNFRITAKNSVGSGPPYEAEEAVTAGKRPSELTNYSLHISFAYFLSQSINFRNVA